MRIAAAQIPAEGEEICGDAYAILNGSTTLVAVADGLGHGPKANEAATSFCSFVESSRSLELPDILWEASRAISSTRGVAAVLLRLDPEAGVLSFAGVGNVDVQAVSRKPIRPVSMPGIVGHRIRKIVQFDYELSPGDLIAIYTDGISSRYQIGDFVHLDEQQMADAIMDSHRKKHDDATCLVIRY